MPAKTLGGQQILRGPARLGDNRVKRHGGAILGDIVIACYRAKPGQRAALLNLAKRYVPLLRRLGLVTDRPTVMMWGAEDTLIEVFEWEVGGIARAHENPEVRRMWEEYDRACTIVRLPDLSESRMQFAEFRPVDDVPAR